MIVKGLDGKEHKLSLRSKPRQNASSLHVRARKIIKELFPHDVFYEEILLKGSKKFNSKNLYADFLSKSQMMVIEVHGKQHYQYCPHFHGSKIEYAKALANDKRKEEWCILNDILYVPLSYKENDDDWKERIRCSG